MIVAHHFRYFRIIATHFMITGKIAPFLSFLIPVFSAQARAVLVESVLGPRNIMFQPTRGELAPAWTVDPTANLSPSCCVVF